MVGPLSLISLKYAIDLINKVVSLQFKFPSPCNIKSPAFHLSSPVTGLYSFSSARKYAHRKESLWITFFIFFSPGDKKYRRIFDLRSCSPVSTIYFNLSEDDNSEGGVALFLRNLLLQLKRRNTTKIAAFNVELFRDDNFKKTVKFPSFLSTVF